MTREQGHDALLQVENLRQAYGGHTVIEGLDFRVRAGEFVSIVGPSGCGKTTLLRTVAGLQGPTGGSITLFGQIIEDVPKGLTLVFQDYSRSLFPWRTVGANVEFPLRRLGLSRSEREERIEESLRSVGLAGAARQYPWQLSGGMQQRAAIARALAYQPRILLMDEPFASVDAQTRSDLEDLILRVWEMFDMTVLFVTHDIDESVYLSDRVLVLAKEPTSLVEEIDVQLPRPREQIDTRSTQEFIESRAHVAKLIRDSAGQVRDVPHEQAGSKSQLPFQQVRAESTDG